MINIAISGANGRMGRAMIGLVAEDPELNLSLALEHVDSPFIGRDAGVQAGIAKSGVAITTNLDPDEFDVLIEFTTPDATIAHLAKCESACKAMLIGTTGMTPDQKQATVRAGENMPVVLAANTSVGVNLCVALLETASKVIGDVTDIEVIEAHHKHKVDAPSGTALLLGEAVAKSLGKSLDKDAVYAREGITGARPQGAIGFSSIRGGNIAGEHTVMFIGESERLEITHRVTDRKIFASGAMRAAKWIARQPKGYYNMHDVLGLRVFSNP
jgi:4-hydroxy-tetrahydrodipicolinate reductase